MRGGWGVACSDETGVEGMSPGGPVRIHLSKLRENRGGVYHRMDVLSIIKCCVCLLCYSGRMGPAGRKRGGERRLEVGGGCCLMNAGGSVLWSVCNDSSAKLACDQI